MQKVCVLNHPAVSKISLMLPDLSARRPRRNKGSPCLDILYLFNQAHSQQVKLFISLILIS